jgi:hypothetical protein
MFEWIPVPNSKRIIAEAYDPQAERIYVRFPDGVEFYYDACPLSLWQEFTAPGQSRGQYIKNVLDFKPKGRHAG